MNGQLNDTAALLYRKRPEPCRVVSLATLRRTNGLALGSSDPALVSSSGVVSEGDSWGPMPHLAAQINVSPSSWQGLRDRLRANRATPAVVA
jgi:hypothetical protein